MADTKISAMTAATAATASTVPVVQSGANRRVAMTGAGAAMIEAANAAAQAALLTTLMPKAGSAFTGLTGAGFRDTSAAFDVTLGFTSSVALDAGRALTIDMGNVAHTIALGTTAGTITFPSHAALTVAGLEIANIFTAAQSISANGAASTPALHGSGTIFTGGSAETTKPYWLIQPSGATSTGWSTAGTLFGANAPSGFTGNLIDLQLVGVSKFKVASTGIVTCAGFTLDQYGNLTCNGSNPAFLGGGRGPVIGVSGFATSMSNSGPVTASGNQYAWCDSTSSYTGSVDAGIARVGAAALKITNGSSGYGSIDASAFKVSGVAGVSGTITAASTVTVVNGIVTVIA